MGKVDMSTFLYDSIFLIYSFFLDDVVLNER
jgi:hypothetical protein